MLGNRTGWALGLAATLLGCSSAGSTDPLGSGTDASGGGGQAAAGSGPGGGGGAAGAGAGGTSAGGTTSGGAAGTIDLGQGGTGSSCDEVGKVIYVVSNENVLLKFSPVDKTFTPIGALSCPTSFGDTPFSMAVDRSGLAFVLYQSGNIYKVDTTTAACKPSGYKPNQKGWDLFGMGYVTDGASGPDETLYVIDNGGGGLGSISKQGVLSPVAQFSQGFEGRTAEVTGRGDGRLFAFFVDLDTDESSVGEIDKATGEVVSNVDQALGKINAWAFAHWGGSFYLFHGTSGSPSKVTRYTPDEGSKLLVSNAGYSIVGAGVSTCAPTVPPIID